MKKSIRIASLAASIVLLAAASGGAQTSDSSSSGSGGGIRGWGPRIGLGSDPDQLIVGLHLDAGRFAPQVRFQPDVELGLGDDVVILDFTGAVHYRFRTQGELDPYAGGGVTFGYVDVDDVDDEDIEFAIEFLGGLEWAIGGGDLFFLEFALLGGDLHDFTLTAGWTF